MNPTVYLFCEGQSGSLDMAVLKSIPFAKKTVVPQPFGGKGGHSRYIDGFGAYVKSLGTTSPNNIIGFRDRDFDFAVPKVPGLTPAGNNVYASFRTTIENYLLEPELFYDFIKTPSINSKYGILYNSVSDVKMNLFDSAAKNIIAFQAARHSLGKIRNSKAKQETNFMKKSGDLPFNLSISSCRDKSYRLIKVFKKESKKFSKPRFLKAFEFFYFHFQSADFIDNKEYLIYFQGKDLQASMQYILPQGFPFNTYYKFATSKFDYSKHPDLVELKSKIEAL